MTRLKNDIILSKKMLESLTYEDYKVCVYDSGELRISVFYKKKYDRFDFPNLPTELNDLVNSFNFHFIYLELLFKFSEIYPFESPNISLSKFRSNFSDNTKHLYASRLERLNKELENDWSSGIYIYHIVIQYISNIYPDIKNSIKNSC